MKKRRQVGLEYKFQFMLISEISLTCNAMYSWYDVTNISNGVIRVFLYSWILNTRGKNVQFRYTIFSALKLFGL